MSPLPPPTPHLAWRGRSKPRDKVLAPGVARALLSRPVLIEEHPDGALIALTADPHTELVTAHRRQAVLGPNAHPQFHTLWGWIAEHEATLARHLGDRYALFGAWCHATHATPYRALPSWFIAVDLLDRESGRFLSAELRDRRLHDMGLVAAPEVARVKTDLADLEKRLDTTPSALGAPHVAGLVVRLEQGDHLVERAVLLNAAVADAPEDPSPRKTLERNALR